MKKTLFQNLLSLLLGLLFGLQSMLLPVTAQTTNQRILAVVDFDNQTGEARFDPLRRVLSEALSTRLAQRPELKVVERNLIDKLLKELHFGQSAYVDQNTQVEIGKMANANLILSGSFVRSGNQSEVMVRLIEVSSGKILVSKVYPFQSESELLPIAHYLALLIPQQLGLYVSDQELENARQGIFQRPVAPVGDQSWILWSILGGAVVIGGIVTAVILLSRPNQNINQNVDTGGTTIINTAHPQSGTQLHMPVLSF